MLRTGSGALALEVSAMSQPNTKAAETGRIHRPEIARPSDEKMAALAHEFWKARGCPQWLWGGLAIRRPLSAPPLTPPQGAKR